MSLAEALKPKPGSKHLSIIVNAEGKEVQAETRDDEEQKVKQQEIIDLLVAAGYFRARIKGLSAFDKVVGGMTWCIDSCDVDIDVDLLFQENLTIGQKISLTEKIVAVLPKMKCPHRIEPHQIQGLDFIHIYPVIQWLVKHSMERRKEMGEYFREYAVNQFNKMYTLPEDKVASDLRQKALINVQSVLEKYRPQRRFRRTGPAPTDLKARVESTLFEYGHVPSSQEMAAPDATKEAQPADEIRAKEIMKNMATMSDQESRLPAGVVGSFVSMQADEIARAVERYTELQAQNEASAAVQIQKLESKQAALEAENSKLEARLQEETSKLEHLKSLKNKESPSHTLTEAEQGVLKKLQSLVTTNEILKHQEQMFREQCQTELATLQQLVKEAEECEGPDGDTEESSKILEDLTERVANARLMLGRKTRTVAALQRQLDQIPTRAELAQYQRRFMELYNQVAAKHRETKQFYTLYNTLNDTHQYLTKELTLLNSILDNYTEAMASPASKEQFMKQFEVIVEGIKQNKAKVEQRRNDERAVCDNLSSQLLALVEQQRQYVSALKQLSIECRNNEVLLSQLRQNTALQA